MSALDFPPKVFGIDTSLNGDRSVIDFIADDVVAGSFAAHRRQVYISPELLESPEAREVVATVLAGDPELASLKADDAAKVLGALVEHFQGGAS